MRSSANGRYDHTPLSPRLPSCPCRIGDALGPGPSPCLEKSGDAWSNCAWGHRLDCKVEGIVQPATKLPHSLVSLRVGLRLHRSLHHTPCLLARFVSHFPTPFMACTNRLPSYRFNHPSPLFAHGPYSRMTSTTICHLFVCPRRSPITS
jgi:hypothetical protein